MMAKDNPSKYPARMGQSWEEEETIKLLTSIQKKKSIEDIAAEHERTVGGINSYIRKLAVEYYFNDKRPIEEIEKFTGLRKEKIQEAIDKHTMTNNKSKRPPKILTEISDTTETLPTLSEVVTILKDIQHKLTVLLQKVE